MLTVLGCVARCAVAKLSLFFVKGDCFFKKKAAVVLTEGHCFVTGVLFFFLSGHCFFFKVATVFV